MNPRFASSRTSINSIEFDRPARGTPRAGGSEFRSSFRLNFAFLVRMRLLGRRREFLKPGPLSEMLSGTTLRIEDLSQDEHGCEM